MRPRVVVYDPIRSLDWSYDTEASLLAARDVDLIIPADEEAAWGQLETADVLIVCDVLPDAAMERLAKCKGILCYKVGLDGVDVGRATAAGFAVRNVPGYCTEEVSDHALALLLAGVRRLGPATAATREGNWDVFDRPDMRSVRRLAALTLGVIGVGRIGRRVVQKAQAFGMPTIAFDPFLEESPLPHLDLVTFEQILAGSDAIVLCAALNEGSRRLIDAGALARMREGVILVNVARGDLVDEVALLDSLRSGHIAVAALDVRSQEPPAADDALAGLSNVILTPHMAAVSRESFHDLHVMAAEQALAILQDSGLLQPGRAS